MLTPDDLVDREDSLRVTALELAIKFRPGVTPEEAVATADRFRVFLAGGDEAAAVKCDDRPFDEWSGSRGASRPFCMDLDPHAV